MDVTNHKAARQQFNRELGKGNRAMRQSRERNQGPNIRIYEVLGPGKGYIQVRLRDGKRVSTMPA